MEYPTALPSPQPDWAWFFDLDGTLLDLAPLPNHVVVQKELIAALATLRSSVGGALAVLSGRPVQQVRDLLEPLRPAAAGLHGIELVTPDGLRHSPKKPLPPIAGLRRMIQEGVSPLRGVDFENKGSTLAIHYRHAPQAERQLRRIIEAAMNRNHGFALLEGKMAFELQPAGIDKGLAIREFMSIPPFLGRRPVFAGDDQTDEVAFKDVAEMGGLTVYVGEEGPTAAQWRIESPAAMRQWLTEMADQLRRKPA
jgi:trehalose 6-phosphate phosphatase